MLFLFLKKYALSPWPPLHWGKEPGKKSNGDHSFYASRFFAGGARGAACLFKTVEIKSHWVIGVLHWFLQYETLGTKDRNLNRKNHPTEKTVPRWIGKSMDFGKIFRKSYCKTMCGIIWDFFCKS